MRRATRRGNGAQQSIACHTQGVPGNGQQYTLSNGTSYPSSAANLGASTYDIAPTACLTADNWGTDPAQCMYPGFGKNPLFITGTNGQPAPTSYPITYAQNNACDLAVHSAPLFNVVNPAEVYGKLFVWKDYSDNLFITVSLNASGWAPPGGAGQYLLGNPTPNSVHPSGVYYASPTFNNQGIDVAAYATNQVLTSSISQWSCFTVMIPLRNACDPATSTYVRGLPGQPAYCKSRTTGQAVSGLDMSSTSNLFFATRFNLTKYDVNAVSCGASSTTVTVTTPMVDLYSSLGGTAGLPLGRNCASLQRPPSPPPPPPLPSSSCSNDNLLQL